MHLFENFKLSNILCRKGKKREAHNISIIFLKIIMVLGLTSWCINWSYYGYLAVFDIKCKLFHNSLSDIICKPLLFFIKIFFHPSKAVSLPNILENGFIYIYIYIYICIYTKFLCIMCISELAVLFHCCAHPLCMSVSPSYWDFIICFKVW